MSTTKLKSLDTLVNIATTSSCATLSATGTVSKKISIGVECGLTISDKVTYKMVLQKYNKHKKTLWKSTTNYKFSW